MTEYTPLITLRHKEKFPSHKEWSLWKSLVRLAACLLGLVALKWFLIGFALAEGLGIAEEWGE